jgi:aspartate/methionine/tyrosine aminotransferase
MNIEPFKLERYFDQYEFNIKYLLSCSDCEPLSMKSLTDNADKELKKKWDKLDLAYTHSAGNDELLTAIASLYENIRKKDILHLVPEEGIYIAMRSLIEHGDQIVCCFPAYQSLYEVAKNQGAELSFWKAQETDKGYIFDVADLKRLVTPDTKMIVINFPHNPTGYTLSQTEFSKVLEIAWKNDCILFSDEMYRFLELSEKYRLPAVCEVYEKGISLCGLSKTFSMPGARSGWLITQNREMMTSFKTYKDYTTICGSAPDEILSLMALRQRKRIIEDNLRTIRKNIKALEALIGRYPDVFSWEPIKAGSIGLVKVNRGMDVNKMAAQLISDKNLMILTADAYHYEANCFRVGFGRKDFKEVLKELEDWVKKNIK